MTNGGENAETTLEDWMREGNWRDSTPQEIADEWDALSEEQSL